MRVMVTGATGFIGSHLLDTLLERGHDVTALVRDPARLKLHAANPRLRAHRGDLTAPETLVAAADDADVVVHLAAVIRARTDADYDAINARGTKAVVDAVIASKKRPKLIYVSSLAAGGPSPGSSILAGEEPPRPMSSYGRTKLAGENIIKEAMGDRPWLILRPPPIYGPRDKDILLLFMLVNMGFSPLPGDGGQILPMLHVVDLAGMLAQAAERPVAGRVFYVSDGGNYPFRDIMAAIARALGKRPVRFHVPHGLLRVGGAIGQWIGDITGRPLVLNNDKVAELGAPAWRCDPTPAFRELNYTPKFDLDSGLADTVRWYRENGWLK